MVQYPELLRVRNDDIKLARDQCGCGNAVAARRGAQTKSRQWKKVITRCSRQSWLAVQDKVGGMVKSCDKLALLSDRRRLAIAESCGLVADRSPLYQDHHVSTKLRRRWSVLQRLLPIHFHVTKENASISKQDCCLQNGIHRTQVLLRGILLPSKPLGR